MSVRGFAALAVALCAALLLVPVSAGAQTPTTGTAVTSLKKIPVTGKARNGRKFTGKYTVDRFVSRKGKAWAVGTLTGKVGNRSVKRSNVAIPTSVGQTGQARTAATCPILHLVLGPVNLNLLGLKVTLGGGAAANQPIVLDITAQSGNGNLLGNLLCSVAGLLDQQGLSLDQLTGLLNLLNSILNAPGVLSL